MAEDDHAQLQLPLEVQVVQQGPALRGVLRRWHNPAIAIERPSGLVVDTLVEAGFTVVPIHPNAVKATRPRYRSHGAKSDASDAYLLADLARTDGHRFKPLAPRATRFAPCALVRGRDDLVATRVQLANQLRSLLESFWPGAAAIFADVDSPIALDFIPRAGRICAAQILAELGCVRERFDCVERLAAEAGVTPVTYASGKSKSVAFRWACPTARGRHLFGPQLAPRQCLGRQCLRQPERAAATIHTPRASSLAPGCA